MADITRPAPECPECGGARHWYGSVEFRTVDTTSYGAIEHLSVAVCSNCGYSSLYLQNLQQFQQNLLNLGFSPSTTDPYPLMSPTPERLEMRAIREAMQAGNKIKAIKLYRELYGCGLQEAKTAIEAMERR